MTTTDRAKYLAHWRAHIRELIFIANSDASLYPEIRAIQDRLDEMIEQAAANVWPQEQEPQA